MDLDDHPFDELAAFIHDLISIQMSSNIIRKTMKFGANSTTKAELIWVC